MSAANSSCAATLAAGSNGRPTIRRNNTLGAFFLRRHRRRRRFRVSINTHTDPPARLRTRHLDNRHHLTLEPLTSDSSKIQTQLERRRQMKIDFRNTLPRRKCDFTLTCYIKLT